MEVIFKPILTFREVTEYLECSKPYLRKLITNGVIKPRYSGARVYFVAEEIVNYIKNCPTNKQA